MNLSEENKYVNEIFKWTLLLKCFNSAWQISLGIFILRDKTILNIHWIRRILPHITHNTIQFVAIYLLLQGILKIFLVVGLIKKKIWVYPFSMYVFLMFIFYQTYRFTHTHAVLLILLSLLDVITILVIERKYRLLLQRK